MGTGEALAEGILPVHPHWRLPIFRKNGRLKINWGSAPDPEVYRLDFQEVVRCPHTICMKKK